MLRPSTSRTPYVRLVLISGLSGSGKSIALNVLEDASYFCVDNIPSSLLPALVDTLRAEGRDRVAVAIDIRSGVGIGDLPAQLRELREADDLDVRFLFLNAKNDTLIRRYSETRRRHPLVDDTHTLPEAIADERERLAHLAEFGHHIDTSDLAAAQLRDWVRQFIATDEATDLPLRDNHGLTLLFQSFGFKYGLPLDADLVFDVRCLPNPHYHPELKALTGCDRDVRDFLDSKPDVLRMREDIRRFIADWLPAFIRDSRLYLTVAIGCTGGQHRSVYFVEWLADRFEDQARVLVRHRQIAEPGKQGR
jgi:UPF0042 nucleotide-binding protein